LSFWSSATLPSPPPTAAARSKFISSFSSLSPLLVHDLRDVDFLLAFGPVEVVFPGCFLLSSGLTSTEVVASTILNTDLVCLFWYRN
jgi:hypothetical protein